VDELTKAYLIRRFREYYSKAELKMPHDFEKREWAFVFIENLPDFFMQRHISFNSTELFQSFLVKSPPAHVYHSSACYLNPSVEMEKKGWLCADLIFDIDADHLPLKPGTPMETALRLAKKEIIKLIGILEDDFGVSRRKMKVVFSGGRGYHIHVFDERFRELESPERRELVDYISLNSPEIDSNSAQMERVRMCFLKIVGKLIERNLLDKLLKKEGVRANSIRRIREKLKLLVEGNIEFTRIEDISKSEGFQRLANKIFSACISRNTIHIDAPVTADVKRLIRFPGSLHGKTGLRVTEIEIDDLEEFDPLRDAVVFGDEKIKLRIPPNVRLDLTLRGEEFRIRGGEKVTLPEYVAVFLICRGIARYGH
jgi:DNA primase small subunit